MNPIDQIREHFNSLGTKKIEVPEWKMTIYSSPVTLAEKNKLYQKSKNNDIELLVDILIMKAQDENGEKLFTIENRAALLNKADSSIIGRVSNEILADFSPKLEELKN